MKSESRSQKTEFSFEHEGREVHEGKTGEYLNEDIKALRLYVARLEGAAKRLLDLLGCPADGRDGPEATVDALRAAADAVVAKNPAASSQQPEWEF